MEQARSSPDPTRDRANFHAAVDAEMEAAHLQGALRAIGRMAVQMGRSADLDGHDLESLMQVLAIQAGRVELAYKQALKA